MPWKPPLAERLCAKCNANPRKKGQRWCKRCHAEYMRAWAKARTAELLRLREQAIE